MLKRFGSLALALNGCLLAACGTPTKNSGPQCLGGAPGEVSVFAPGIGSTEGIAFLNGKLYVAGGQSVREISTDGKATVVAPLAVSVGVVAWHGALYVAGKPPGERTSGLCDPGNMGVIFKVTPGGEVSTFATGLISPNFLTVTPWDTLLVSDDCLTNNRIWEVTTAGVVSIWNQDILSANGMVFNAAKDTLFVAGTFTDPAPLWSLSIGADHKASNPKKIHDYDSSSAPDGLAMDSTGVVYVALNTDGVIHKVTPDGVDHEFAEGMLTPASMAFGDGAGFDPCSMYTTSLLGTDVYRVVVGTTGQPLFQ